MTINFTLVIITVDKHTNGVIILEMGLFKDAIFRHALRSLLHQKVICSFITVFCFIFFHYPSINLDYFNKQITHPILTCYADVFLSYANRFSEQIKNKHYSFWCNSAHFHVFRRVKRSFFISSLSIFGEQ